MKFFYALLLSLAVLAAFSVSPALAADEPKEEGESGGVGYLNMNAITVPVFTKGRTSQFIILEFVIQVADANKIPDVEAKMPRIRDQFIQTMYGEDAQKRVMMNNQINLVAVKRMLLSELKKMFDDGIIEDLLVHSVNQQLL